MFNRIVGLEMCRCIDKGNRFELLIMPDFELFDRQYPKIQLFLLENTFVGTIECQSSELVTVQRLVRKRLSFKLKSIVKVV